VIEDAWTHVESGRTTAVVGGFVPAPPEAVWTAVRVSCGEHPEPGGAIAAASEALDAFVNEGVVARAKQRLTESLLRRLVGDTEEPTPIEAFVERIRRAALSSPHPLALVFDDVIGADPESLRMLGELVGHPTRLSAALILQFETMPSATAGTAAEVLARVRSIEGPAGLVGTDHGPETWAELHPVLKAALSTTLR
jgi:hypothetical protein